eukprot:m.123140 g.123140  ORF g.123140 m.123140 type:complete len:69 (+) comp52144_c0_seq1:696-902(+)
MRQTFLPDMANTNSQDVARVERERRERASAEAQKVAQRDKASNVADKQDKAARKEARKAAAQKGERRR